MIRREIDLDEESNKILSELAQDYEGDMGKALTELLHAHQSVEAFVDECEEAQRDSLLAQKERSERGFREGRVKTWEEVKRRNNL